MSCNHALQKLQQPSRQLRSSQVTSMTSQSLLYGMPCGGLCFHKWFLLPALLQIGDRRSGGDRRSCSLTGSLKAAFLLQASVVILECVQPAGEDSFVQGCIRSFESLTGFHCFQTILESHKVWGTRRTRWWAIPSAPSVGRNPLESWKANGPWHAVEDIVDTFNTSRSELQQLALQPLEVEAFEVLRPMSRYCVKHNQPLPTALHSRGSALTACPCHCRPKPFTWERLRQDGTCSVVLPICEDVTCKGSGTQPRKRSQSSMAGLSLSLQIGQDERLALALIGQLASPLQSACLLGALARTLCGHGVALPGAVDAIQILHTQRRILLREGEVEGYI